MRLGGQQNTGSTSSDDRPPPLPPKPTGRFGFGLRKAAGSPRDLTPPLSPGIGAFEPELSPPRVNKPSRIFGSNVHTSGDGLDSKLATLRDMGFPDEKRNCTVLKGLNGNLDRAVETLIRLGEQNVGASGGNTPTPPTRSASTSLTFERANSVSAATSTNPFDALDAQQRPQAAPQAHLATGGVSSAPPVSPSHSYNPFLQSATQAGSQQPQPTPSEQNAAYQQNPWAPQQQNFGQPSQGVQLLNLPPQTPLFPNRTGGYGPVQSSPYAQTNPFQQSFTPPHMPQISEQYSSFPSQAQTQSLSSPSSPGNPFLKSSRSQVFTPLNLAATPHDQPSFYQQQQPSQQASFQQIQEQHQPQSQQPNPWATQSYGQTPTASAPNPWQAQPQSMPSQQTGNPMQQQPGYAAQPQSFHGQQTGNPMQQQPGYAAQPQSFQDQQTGHPVQQPGYATQPQSFQDQQQSFQNQRIAYQQQSTNPFDKKAILSLYNQAQPVQQLTQPPQASLSPAPTTNLTSGYMSPFGHPSAAKPLSAAQTPGIGHVSNESVDFSGLLGGRHSPDAFSGLSSSFRR